jgi:hypothetical protein
VLRQTLACNLLVPADGTRVSSAVGMK